PPKGERSAGEADLAVEVDEAVVGVAGFGVGVPGVAAAGLFGLGGQPVGRVEGPDESSGGAGPGLGVGGLLVAVAERPVSAAVPVAGGAAPAAAVEEDLTDGAAQHAGGLVPVVQAAGTLVRVVGEGRAGARLAAGPARPFGGLGLGDGVHLPLVLGVGLVTGHQAGSPVRRAGGSKTSAMESRVTTRK